MPYQPVSWTHFSISAQGPLFMMLEIIPGLDMCKAGDLSTHPISLAPYIFTYLEWIDKVVPNT